MRTEECAGHTIEYALGWKACIEWMKTLPSAQPEITDEQAIDHLEATGWLKEHDRQMYEMGIKEQLKDDSGSYDSLIPQDCISRQAAIDAIAKFVPYAICDESTESYTNGLTDAYNLICQLPSAQTEIIRCKDCKFYTHTNRSLKVGICRLLSTHFGDDGYCSEAERREDGN
jgi:hypothetical protein